VGDHGRRRGTTNYDAINERLNTRDDPPDGGLLHTAGFDEDAGVFRIFDVWESREHRERFIREHRERFIRERLMPIIQEMTAGRSDAPPPDRETWYELHDLIV
jgi:hypothetical protein